MNKNTYRSVLVVMMLFVGLTAAKADNVDDFVQEQMRQQHIPGLSLAVVRDGKIIKAQAYGLADVEQNVAATPDTVFEIGSVTKQFTAAAIMLLYGSYTKKWIGE